MRLTLVVREPLMNAASSLKREHVRDKRTE